MTATAPGPNWRVNLAAMVQPPEPPPMITTGYFFWGSWEWREWVVEKLQATTGAAVGVVKCQLVTRGFSRGGVIERP